MCPYAKGHGVEPGELDDVGNRGRQLLLHLGPVMRVASDGCIGSGPSPLLLSLLTSTTFPAPAGGRCGWPSMAIVLLPPPPPSVHGRRRGWCRAEGSSISTTKSARQCEPIRRCNFARIGKKIGNEPPVNCRWTWPRSGTPALGRWRLPE